MLRGVRPSGRLALLFAVVVVVSWAGCGGTSIDGTLGPTGGSVCLPDNKVCINVPIGALETQEVLRISPGSDSPGGALSDAYDISGGSGRPVVFVKAATVSGGPRHAITMTPPGSAWSRSVASSSGMSAQKANAI